PALPDWDAAKKKPDGGAKKESLALPDWDAAKKKPDGGAKKDSPALPDWEAEKAKAKPAAPAKAKKPARKPGQAAGAEAAAEEATPEAGATPEAEATPVAEAPPTATEESAPPEAPPAATPEAPEPAPAAPVGPSDADLAALRRARGEMISGGVLLGLGVGGLGAMTAGALLKRSAEQDNKEGAADELRRADTIMAVGGVVGVMTVAIGAALLAEGARDRKAARAQLRGRVRVAPTLGGFVIRGRF
ncbi:MAG TPA: hypothetical protein VIK91_03920, partial [Nannocystis sp.]